MKKARLKIKDHIITGALIVIPIAVVVVILADVAKKLIDLTTPITENMAVGGPVVKAIVASIIVALALGLFLFINGLLARTYLGSSFKKWIEKKVFVHIPFYSTFSNVAHQLTGEEKENYPVVEIDLYGSKNKVLGLLTERMSDGRLMVYIPFAPLLNIGQLHIIAKENAKVLDISVKDATEIVTRIGFESNKFYPVE